MISRIAIRQACRSSRLVSENISKYRLSARCRSVLSYERKCYILNCVASLECSVSYLGYRLGNYYFCDIRLILKRRCKYSRYRNTANISRNPHRSTCSVICAQRDGRSSTIYEVRRLVLFCPIRIQYSVCI